mmetsp:Transcript_3035/g.8761  ORF Transcript_3035/g.8761 Transcript_3035/m.8761 type:complete len:520 (-) Transcript_3035:4558-6117(-)
MYVISSSGTMTGRSISSLSSLLLLWTAGHLSGVGDAFQPVCFPKKPAATQALAAAGGFGASTSSSSKRNNKKSKGGKGGFSDKNEQKKLPATTTSADLVAAFEATSRGRDLQSKGALNGAIVSFTEALELHPTVDRQFHLAMALEENGEPQRAIEMFEQAQRNDMADAILGHDVHLKLAHLWAHDLGDVQRGIGHVDQALAMEGYIHTSESDAVAWYQKAFFVADQGRLAEAIALWDSAIEVMEQTNISDEGDSNDEPANEEAKKDAAERVQMAKFYRSVAQGLLEKGQDVVEGCVDQYMKDSWKYAISHYPKARLEKQKNAGRIFSGTYTMLEEALQMARPDGIVAEFGVFHGKSIRLISSMTKDAVDGFDTFEGIPEQWGDEPAGSYTASKEIPERVPENVRFHVGLFSDTLPGYVASLPPPEELPVKMLNIDCDLYQGTVEILHYLSDRIGPGSVLIFDEYLMTPTWPEDEYKAFQESCEKFGWEYEYLGFSLFSKQVSVRITASESFAGPMAEGF